MAGKHKHNESTSQNQKAQLTKAYSELGKELSSTQIKVVGNYTLGKVIGEGAYGKVRMGTHRLTSTRVAIKQIPKSMSTALTREIHHHRQLHHPNIMQMFEVIATESSIWIVTELCYGGELFDYLVEKGRLSEDETKVVFGQLCLAVNYLHEKGIVHRDLKLENVLLDEKCRVKLGDFGFTREYESNVLMETFCGTTGYASPEMLQSKKYFGPEVDIWSLGVILYCLLTGTLPFDDDDDHEMRNKIIKGVYEDPEWLSAEARDLIFKILQQDPSKRPSIANILAHPWFYSRPSPSRKSSTNNQEPNTTSPRTSSSSTPDLFYRSSQDVSSEGGGTGLTTPDDLSLESEFPSIKRNNSEATIGPTTENKSKAKKVTTVEAVPEEGEDKALPALPHKSASDPTSSKPPPPLHPSRTPARTKRRSISSTLEDPDLDSAPSSPTTDKPPGFSSSPSSSAQQPNSRTSLLHDPAIPSPRPSNAPRPDFASLLRTPAPMIFSTPLERDLLNTLSGIGYDTGQIVHSVLSDACDAAGAVWWMLLRKAEKREKKERAEKSGDPLALASKKEKDLATDNSTDQDAKDAKRQRDKDREKEKDGTGSRRGKIKFRHASAQTDREPAVPLALHLVSTSSGGIATASYHHSAPQLAFLPATPTFPPPGTPPAAGDSSVTTTPMLSPSSALLGINKPCPETPSALSEGRGSVISVASSSGTATSGGGASTGGGTGSKGRKTRSGSVSMGIMQRATTALEAAGLVRKKSSETVKGEHEAGHKEEKRHGHKDKEKRDSDRRSTTLGGGHDEPWGSLGSVGGRSLLSNASAASTATTIATATGSTKSPKLKAQQEPASLPLPSTPPHQTAGSGASGSDLHHPQPQVFGSPWVLTGATPVAGEKHRSHPSLQGDDLHSSHHPQYSARSSSLLHSNALPHESQQMRHPSVTAPTPANSPGIGLDGNPSPDPMSGSGSGGKGGLSRNRTSILSAFGMWLGGDRKGKRKDQSEEPVPYARLAKQKRKHVAGGAPGTIKRRPSNSANIKASPSTSSGAIAPGGSHSALVGGRRTKRHSASSRRSSSVNSRRSSTTSAQMAMLDPMGLHRTHTPDSGRIGGGGGEFSSRPSSIHSFSLHGTSAAGHHRKSPSASSVGSSVYQIRGTSPLPGSKYYHNQNHRRGGSGSSTRVIRQVQPPKSNGSHGGPGGRHARSGSTASSIQQSPASSRPASFYEDMDALYPRTASPLRAPSSRRSSMDDPPSASTPRRGGFGYASGHSHGHGSTTFIAQKRQGPFTSPSSSGGSIGRTSWKKSWGLEPPGWQTRTTQLPVEILSVSPVGEASGIRDVFTRRPSLTLSSGHGGSLAGDEDDWVDEDDDVPPFAGGLGQGVNWGSSSTSSANSGYGTAGLGISTSMGTGSKRMHMETISLSAPPNRNSHRSGNNASGSGKRMSKGDGAVTGSGHAHGAGATGGQESGSSGGGNGDGAESRGGAGARSRRDLPSGRAGQSFKMPIQEEEEEEEE